MVCLRRWRPCSAGIRVALPRITAGLTQGAISAAGGSLERHPHSSGFSSQDTPIHQHRAFTTIVSDEDIPANSTAGASLSAFCRDRLLCGGSWSHLS